MALLLLSSVACRPDAPATDQASAPAPPKSVASAPAAAVAPAADTLQLPGGQLVRLQPSTAAAFERLAAAETLPQDVDAETPEAAWLAPTQGRVQRQGLELLLRPEQGPVVRLRSTPEEQMHNDDATVRYQYWGSLPAAHQWVVKAWYWESDGVVLVDQRSGARQEVAGYPAASPDGRYVLATSPGLGGGDQVNSLSLLRVEPSGLRLLWQREPTAWAPEKARWAGPDRVLLELSRPGPNGQLPEPPQPEYAELKLPLAP